MTPEAAAAAGATYLVLGRSVTTSKQPRDAMEAVNASLRS
jgi:orotidine-5'-phosphate decarboxylase